MSNTNIMRSYADEIDMIIQRGRIPSTGEYDTVKSAPTSMDDPSEYVLEYR